jgi:hypothetical protein
VNDLTAKRTLVKSAPELWSELSEVERLARHLGAFGEIKITKLEPEHTVAWEGEAARGTVSIEPSAWGTKVTLTAQLAETVTGEVPEAGAGDAEHRVVGHPVAEHRVAEHPVVGNRVAAHPVTEHPVGGHRVAEEPVAEQPVPEEPGIEEQPVAEEQPVDEAPGIEEPPVWGEQPVDVEPPVEEPPVAVEEPEVAVEEQPPPVEALPPVAEAPPVPPAARKRGFLARLFGRRAAARRSPVAPGAERLAPLPVWVKPPEPEAMAEPEPLAAEPVAAEPDPVTAEQEPIVEAPVAAEPVAAEPVAAEPITEEPVSQDAVTEQPVAEQQVSEQPVADPPDQAPTPHEDEAAKAEDDSRPLDFERAQAILDETLEALGSAHHRPYSRA